MTATYLERNRVGEKLPHALLEILYRDARTPIKLLVKELQISHHTISKYLAAYGERYGLCHTLDINTALLGFSETRIIAIKFEDRRPDIEILKTALAKEPFIQNAYTATGDFDLVLHVIASDHVAYSYWLYRFRLGFCRYKPRVKISTLDNTLEGFMPINGKLIEKSTKINIYEKKLILKLIENSRIKIKDLAKNTGSSPMRVIYSINKLKAAGIIKGFTTCIQNPEKRIFLFYGTTLIPNGDHHSTSLLKFLDRIITEERIAEATNDYSFVCETSGHFDIVFFCNFSDGNALSSRGPDFLKRAWASESPLVEQCVLTDVIVGKWPFNKNGYVRWSGEREGERKDPTPIKIY